MEGGSDIKCFDKFLPFMFIQKAFSGRGVLLCDSIDLADGAGGLQVLSIEDVGNESSARITMGPLRLGIFNIRRAMVWMYVPCQSFACHDRDLVSERARMIQIVACTILKLTHVGVDEPMVAAVVVMTLQDESEPPIRHLRVKQRKFSYWSHGYVVSSAHLFALYCAERSCQVAWYWPTRYG